jgi:hypothetical protein
MGLGTEKSGLINARQSIKVTATGKTVQMIATMAMNLPSADEDNKTTLIIVPAALLDQVCLFRYHCYVGFQLFPFYSGRKK